MPARMLRTQSDREPAFFTETMKDIGEFAFIQRLIGTEENVHGVIKGIGDDAAVLDSPGNDVLLLTTDMLVEGAHFLRTTMSPQEIGRKALACSVSDIAAMGGSPTFAVISVAAPSNITTEFLLGVNEGVKTLAEECGVAVVGGDMTAHSRVVINVALLGRVEKDRVVYRRGAKRGDRIFVTGPLGNSFETKKHIYFQPRVEEARFLVSEVGPSAMIDISDGLAGDLGHIMSAGKCGALLNEEAVPCADGADLVRALHDGEDFELLFTVSEKAADIVRQQTRFRFYELGHMTSGKNLLLEDKKGRRHRIVPKGYEHF
ncbi:MAG: thiamine-phosphate kinase [Candidatus Omnitrophota bacterium]